MIQTPVLVDLDAANVARFPCCGIKSAGHEGRCNKIRWLKTQFKKGLRARMLVAPGGRPCGYIEYVPGEYAWRGVDAAGYLFIHCVWTFYKQYQHKGVARSLVQAAVEEARQTGRDGVAVVAREGPWLAGPALFLANGFEVVDSAPPDYQLLVRKLNPSAANPAFKGDWDKKRKKYSKGLTIIRSTQCPHIAKFADEIVRTAEVEYGLTPRQVVLKSHKEAQNAPTPYAVFAVLYNGRVLADHQVSRTRFRNIMKKAMGQAGDFPG